MWAYEGQQFLDGSESDPRRLGLMEPSHAASRIGFKDGTALSFPTSRWTLSNAARIFPTVSIDNRPSARHEWALSSNWAEQISALTFRDLNQQTVSWSQFLVDTYTDGLAISHQGKLVYEYYFGALSQGQLHLGFSLTKSIVMSLMLCLLEELKIRPDQRVTDFIPALKHSAYANATLDDVMDMRMAVNFDESVDNPYSHACQYAHVSNMLPYPRDATHSTLREFLQSLQADGDHGGAFRYLSTHTEVIAWLIETLSSTAVVSLLSECLWQPMGASQAANIIVDDTQVPICGAGMSLCLRDLLLFGELIRQDGAMGNRQILPARQIQALYQGGDTEAFKLANYPLLPGYRYHRQWWLTGSDQQALEGRGIFGQRLFIAPKDEFVIARFSSHPIATSAANDPLTIPAIRAVRQLLTA